MFLKPRAATMVLTNHAMPGIPIRIQDVAIRLSGGLPRRVYVERIHQHHANPRAVWKKMGSPTYLGSREVERLMQASAIQVEDVPWEYRGNEINLHVRLSPHAIAALTIDFE